MGRHRRLDSSASQPREGRQVGSGRAHQDKPRWHHDRLPTGWGYFCRGGPRRIRTWEGEAMVYRAARIGGPGRWTSRSRRGAGASFVLLLLLIGLGLWLAGCGGGPHAAAGARATLPARWVRFLHIPGVVDLTGPRDDERLTVAAARPLSLLRTFRQPAA